MQMPGRQLDRKDRHVLHSYVRMSARASRFRVEFSLEEALRLANLPGEEEGRVYFFRCVLLAGITGQTSRKAWMDRVQQVLTGLAIEAVHGKLAHAGSASAVYFDSQEQALETLLHSALCGRPTEWFANTILQLAPGSSTAAVVFALVDRLRHTLPPAATAAIVLSVLERAPSSALVSLLHCIADTTARAWLRDNDARDAGQSLNHTLPIGAAPPDPPVILSQARRSMIVQAAHRFGWKDPRTIWFASLAVNCALPASIQPLPLLRRTHATLRLIEPESAPPETTQEASPATRRPTPLRFDEDEAVSTNSVPASGTQAVDPDSVPQERPAAGVVRSPLPPAPVTPAVQAFPAPSPVSGPVDPAPRSGLLGEPTDWAGLYFLLHPLRRLGIASALDACPALAEAGLVTHLLHRLARQADAPAQDPILLCLDLAGAEFALPAATLAAMPRLAWPANLRPPEDTACSSRGLLRAWTLGVRRWCWHTASLKLHQIVRRRGAVWTTRADIDVTLPLQEADLRIRRVGLDIDPGWLPWLGHFGRVVRFHYRGKEWDAAAGTEGQ